MLILLPITVFCPAQATLVFYVPPHGLRAVLADLVAVLGGARRCCVARELTKLHEAFYRGTLADIAATFELEAPRGEVTLCVAAPSEEDRRARAREKVCKLELGSLLPRGGLNAGVR